MSSKRVIASCAAMATVVAMGGWYAVSAFPLRQSGPHVAAQPAQQGAGTLEAQAKPVTPENPVPRRVSYVAPIYPDAAAAEQMSGSVTVRLTLAADGSVAETRAIGFSFRAPHAPTAGKVVAPTRTDTISADGPQKALIDAAVDAVRQWRYDPPFEAPLAFNVTINFRPDKAGGVESALPPPPPPPPPPPAGVSAGVQGGVAGGVSGGVVGGVSGGVAGNASHTQAPPPPPPPPAFEAGALRVGGTIGPPKKIRDVKPAYPQEAKAAGIQGVVILEIRVDEEGNVSDARVLRSIPELDEAALTAVRQWGFTPTLMNGKPVPIVATVTVNFTLE